MRWTALLIGLAACGGGAEAALVTADPPPAASADAGTLSVVDAGAPAAPRDSSVDAAVAAKPTASGCVTDVTAGHHVFSCDGIQFDVEISAACAGGGCGVVLDVHGLTMNADQEDRSTRLRSLGAARGFVVVQPTAPRGLIGPSWTPANDDDKVWSFLGDVRRALVIDDHRVHVTGFSQGGAMTWRLLCKHADEIASAAPIAAADAKSLDSNTPPFRLDCAFDATSKPSRPISILHMHGTKDALVPFDKAKQQRDAVLAWLGPTTESIVASGDGFVHTRYSTPTNDVVYEFVQHDYVASPPLLPVTIGGHCFPGGDDLNGQAPGESMFFSCAPPNGFKWGLLVMDFFVAHPKP